MTQQEYRNKLRELLRNGLVDQARELEQKFFSMKNKSMWSPEYGWLTNKELSAINSGEYVADFSTKDETLRGYRLNRQQLDKEKDVTT